jgi:hypothetical protein
MNTGAISLARIVIFVVGYAVSMFHPRAAHAAEREARVASGLYVPKATRDALEWDARFVLSVDDAAAVRDDDTVVIRFARPLPSGESLWMESPGLSGVPTPSAIYEDGRMVGLRVPGSLVDGRAVRTTFVQRPLPTGDRWLLGAPVAEGTAAQIIEGSPGGFWRFELDDPRFEPHVGHQTSRAIDHAAREEARRLTGEDTRVTGNAIFVRGEDLRTGGDLVARVVSPRDRARKGYLALIGVFAAIVAGLLVALRRLRHAASVERADALLAAEIEGGR